MRTILALVVLSVAALIAGAPAADAGGPTSVIVTNPDGGTATALYYTDGQYERLDRLLHDGTPAQQPPSSVLESTGSYYNVTWLIHDAVPWRMEQVYLDAKGGPYVATRDHLTEPGLSDEAPRWTRPTGSTQLAALLPHLLQGHATPLAPTHLTASAPETSTVTPPALRWWSLAGWRWAVPGLVTGLLVGALARRRRAQPPLERRVLVDRDQSIPTSITS